MVPEQKKVVAALRGARNYLGVDIIEKYLREECPDAVIEIVDILPSDEFVEVASDAQVIVSQYQRMTEEMYEHLPQLRAYVSMGIGFNSANLEAATKCGVVVTNVPDYCTDEVAAHTVALILAFQRGFYKLIPWIKGGNWSKDAIVPRRRFAGSTVGLYGFGGIARNVAEKLSGFEVKIIASDPYVSQEVADTYNVKMVEFDELITESDIISIHAPLLPSTTGIFNEQVFKKMKKHAYLVNCGRGPIIKMEDLYKALTEGWIAGAALDVVEHEPIPQESDWKLIQLPNVWATGHTAFYSEASFDELMQKSANEAGRVLRGERPRRCVNKEVLEKIDWFID